MNRQVEAEKQSMKHSLLLLLFYYFYFYFLVAEGVASINSALSSSDSSTVLNTLISEHVGLEEVDSDVSPHYVSLMKAALASKIEVE